MLFRDQIRSFLIKTVVFARADAFLLRFKKPDPNTQGLVVMMHETPVSSAAHLHDQLEWASQFFTITNLESFATLWNRDSRSMATAKPLLLFSFDDGRESNHSVAAPLLESFGGRGVFFIVPAFAESAGEENSLAYYRSRISPDPLRQDSCNRASQPRGEESEDWKPMSIAQIGDLASRGHAIGNHTASHRRLFNLSPSDLEREIGQSARQLESWTGKPIDAFAWTFGWDAIDANAWATIQRYHRFCFSPCAGLIDANVDQPSLLWRREIEARYSEAEYRLSYSGIMDYWWALRRKRLRAMVSRTARS